MSVRSPLPLTRLNARSSGKRRNVDAIHLAHPLLGQVDLVVRVVDRPDDDVFRLGVGVDHLVVELDLEEAEIRTPGNHADARSGNFCSSAFWMAVASAGRVATGSAALAASTGIAAQISASDAIPAATASRVRSTER